MYKLLLLFCGIDFFLFAYDYKTGKFDILFGVTYTLWYPRQDGLELFYKVNAMPTVSDADGLPAISTVVRPEMNASSGFQFSADYSIDKDRSYLSVLYFWFNNQGSDYLPVDIPGTSQMENNKNYILGYPDGFPKDSATLRLVDYFLDDVISSSWNNTFHRFDLTTKRLLYGNNNLYLTPFMGISFAFDSQRLQFSYVTINDRMKQRGEWDIKENWWGVGPYCGVFSNYCLWYSQDRTHSFSFATKCGTLLALSSTDLLAEYSAFLASGDSSLASSYSTVVYQVSPALDTFFGFVWEADSDGLKREFSIGWEGQIWFSHNYMDSPFGIYAGKGTYSMDGLNLKFALGF